MFVLIPFVIGEDVELLLQYIYYVRYACLRCDTYDRVWVHVYIEFCHPNSVPPLCCDVHSDFKVCDMGMNHIIFNYGWTYLNDYALS